MKTATAKLTTPVSIRWMIRKDMPEVLGIEAANFDWPWPEDEFINCLRQRNCIGMVAEHGGKVAGFMLYELHAKKLYLDNFAVHASMHRKGVGRAMVQKLIGKLYPTRRNRIMAEVRESNLDAQLFFKAMGFKAISVLEDYYEANGETAYLFQYRLSQGGK